MKQDGNYPVVWVPIPDGSRSGGLKGSKRAPDGTDPLQLRKQTKSKYAHSLKTLIELIESILRWIRVAILNTGLDEKSGFPTPVLFPSHGVWFQISELNYSPIKIYVHQLRADSRATNSPHQVRGRPWRMWARGLDPHAAVSWIPYRGRKSGPPISPVPPISACPPCLIGSKSMPPVPP